MNTNSPNNPFNNNFFNDLNFNKNMNTVVQTKQELKNIVSNFKKNNDKFMNNLTKELNMNYLELKDKINMLFINYESDKKNIYLKYNNIYNNNGNILTQNIDSILDK